MTGQQVTLPDNLNISLPEDTRKKLAKAIQMDGFLAECIEKTETPRSSIYRLKKKGTRCSKGRADKIIAFVNAFMEQVEKYKQQTA